MHWSHAPGLARCCVQLLVSELVQVPLRPAVHRYSISNALACGGLQQGKTNTMSQSSLSSTIKYVDVSREQGCQGTAVGTPC